MPAIRALVATPGFTPREAHTADHYDAVVALVGGGLAWRWRRDCARPRLDPEMVVRVLQAEQPRRTGDRAPHLRSVVHALERTAASFSATS